MNSIPEDAIILPNKEIKYLAVWQTEHKLVLRLLNGPKVNEQNSDVYLDNKILPDLVDALIELQNR